MTKSEESMFLPRAAGSGLRDLVAEALRARVDPAKCLEFLDEACVFHVVGRPEDYPYSGSYRGRAQIIELLRRIDADVETSERRLLNMIVDGDRIALRRSVVARHHGTAAVARLVFADLATVRDGRIVEIYEYADTCWLKRLAGDED